MEKARINKAGFLLLERCMNVNDYEWEQMHCPWRQTTTYLDGSIVEYFCKSNCAAFEEQWGIDCLEAVLLTCMPQSRVFFIDLDEDKK